MGRLPAGRIVPVQSANSAFQPAARVHSSLPRLPLVEAPVTTTEQVPVSNSGHGLGWGMVWPGCYPFPRRIDPPHASSTATPSTMPSWHEYLAQMSHMNGSALPFIHPVAADHPSEGALLVTLPQCSAGLVPAPSESMIQEMQASWQSRWGAGAAMTSPLSGSASPLAAPVGTSHMAPWPQLSSNTIPHNYWWGGMPWWHSQNAMPSPIPCPDAGKPAVQRIAETKNVGPMGSMPLPATRDGVKQEASAGKLPGPLLARVPLGMSLPAHV